MIVATTPTISGKRIVKTIGMVKGTTVRAHHVGNDIIAYLRNLVGGEVLEYTKMLAEAREQAIDRMKHEAIEAGANAVVSTHFSTSDIASGAAEVLAYGTAVVVEDE